MKEFETKLKKANANGCLNFNLSFDNAMKNLHQLFSKIKKTEASLVKKAYEKANIPLYIAIKMENKKDFERNMWLPLPVTQEQFTLAVYGICDCWDDLEINWCSSTVPNLYLTQMREVPIAVLNHLAARLNSLTHEQSLILAGLMESLYSFYSVKEIIEYTYNPGLFAFAPGIYTYKQLGRFRANKSNFSSLPCGRSLPRRLKDCLDMGLFGRQSAANEIGYFTPLGYISIKRKAWIRLTADRNRRVPADLELKGINGEDLFITDNFDSFEFSELPEPEME